jgi:plastocyanin
MNSFQSLWSLPRIVGYLGLAGLLMACASGGGTAETSPQPAPVFLQSDASTKSATLTLVSSYNSANAGFNFDGYDAGKMVVSIPDGWKVTVMCGNKGTGNHSCAIVKKAGDQTPAFPGSNTPAPAQGFPPGGSQTFTFTATSPGTYRISCLVGGHDDAGMWDTFIVTASGEPSISFK